MKLGMEVGLSPGHIVLDGDPAPTTKRGTGFPCVRIMWGPCLLWPNGWMDQDAIWYAGRPWPRPHCVRWGPSSLQKRSTAAPNFRPIYCGQTAGWIKMKLGAYVGLGLGHIVLDWDPVPPPKGKPAPSNFQPMTVVAKRLMDQDATW